MPATIPIDTPLVGRIKKNLSRLYFYKGDYLIDFAKELVKEYITGVIEELGKGNKVAFFNPSGERDWNQADDLHPCRYRTSPSTGPRVETNLAK